jgi:ankyrin repeat protein
MKKKRLSKKEKIKQEIIDRVFAESEAVREKRQQKAVEDIEIESLSEVSGLSKKRIAEITKSVKAKHKLNKKKIVNRILLGISILIAGVILFFIVQSVVESIIVEVEKQQKLDYAELLNAASAGDIDKIEELRAKGVAWDHKDFPYDSLLFRAVLTNNVDLIKYLISNGVNLFKQDQTGKNALDLAYEKRFLEVQLVLGEAIALLAPEGHPLRTLWQKKIGFCEYNFRKYIEANDMRVIELFCLADEGIFSHDWDSANLVFAASEASTDMLLFLLKNAKDLKQDHKSWALFPAARDGDIVSLEALLTSDADINFKRSDNFTPLVQAICSGKQSVELLLDKGADPNVTAGSDEYLPIFMALQDKIGNYISEQRRYEIVKALIDAGVDINHKGYNNRLPIEAAWGRKFFTIAGLLKEHGSELPFSESAFRYLVMENDYKAVQQFIQKGIDPDLAGFDFYDEDMTALMYAAKNGLLETARVLLEQGANSAKKTKDGYDAYYYAEYYRRNNIKNLLIKYGYRVK